MGSRGKRDLIELLILFGVLFLPGYVYQSGAVDPNTMVSMPYALRSIIIGVPQIALLMLFVRNDRRTAPTEEDVDRSSRYADFSIRATDVPHALVLTVGLIGISFLLSALGSLLPSGGNYLERLQTQNATIEMMASGVLVSAVAAYREELYFRVLAFDRLDAYGGSRVATVGALSLLFGLGHLYQGVAPFLITAAIGMLLAIDYICYRRIHVIVWAHALFNIGSLAIAAYAGSNT